MRNTYRPKSLTTFELHSRFVCSLGDMCDRYSALGDKPLHVIMGKMNPYNLRVYLFHCGNPPGGRSVDEYKIVLNIGQPRGHRGHLDETDGYYPMIVGYVSDYDVFVIWDAMKHQDFTFNKNLQVRADTILCALGQPLSLQNRQTQKGKETVIACRSKFLGKAITERMQLLFNEVIYSI